MTAKKTIKKSLTSYKYPEKGSKKPVIRKSRTTKKKYAVLKFDLENEHEWDSFKNAMKADHLVNKIDDLYSEIFRPHLKHDVPIEYDGGVIEMDEKAHDILRAIFYKCNEHFYPSDDK